MCSTVALAKVKASLLTKSAVSLLNRSCLKRKKSTWAQQTDPFLFAFCQVTVKKTKFYRVSLRSDGRRETAAETASGLHMEAKLSWTASFESIEATPENLTNFPSDSPAGLNVELSPHNLKL